MKKLLLTLLFTAVLAAESAQAQDDGTIVFMPQWTAQAQFAGYYVAETKGFIRKQG